MLPTVGSIYSSTITWASNNQAVIDNAGAITLPEETTTVVLTATIDDGTNVETKEFTFTVIGVGTQLQSELNKLSLPTTTKENLTLPE